MWGESNSKLWSQGLRKDRAEVHLREMRKRGQASRRMSRTDLLGTICSKVVLKVKAERR